MKDLFYSILTLLIIISCSGGAEYEERMTRAENVIDDNPDSAITILDSINPSLLSHNRRMRYHLKRTLAQNRAYIPFTSDSVMKEVVEYYENTGTPNEKILANYLMGRVYSDMDNPMAALEFFHKAVEHADTTADDCDFKTLSRVHGQIADLFHSQLLPEYELKEERLAVEYAWKAKDTLAALVFYEHLVGPYSILGVKDSVISVSHNVSEMYRKYGYTRKASACWPSAIFAYLEQKKYKEAKLLIDDLIQNSGRVDDNGNFKEGHENCYSFICMYYEGINKLDSAEFFYRKYLEYPIEMPNHEIAYKGLMSIYQKRGISDSVAKYAQIYCEYNDSSYRRLMSEKVNRMQAIYDYSYNKHIADMKTIEAKQYKLWVYYGIVFIIIAANIMLYRQKKLRCKRVAEAEAYAKIMFQYSRTKKDLKLLQNDYEVYQETKQQEIEKLKNKISSYQKNNEKTDEWKIEEDIFEENSIQEMHKIAAKGKIVPDDKWNAFTETVKKYYPHFILRINEAEYNLTTREIQICILIKLKFIPAEIGILLNLSTQQVTNTRRSINKKLFGADGAKTLDKNITKIIR